MDLREYIPSSEWDVLNTSATRHIRRYPFFDTDPYPELIFSLTLKRQSTFYIYLLVLPCILLSCLTLVLFWIPPQRPDRTAVGKYSNSNGLNISWYISTFQCGTYTNENTKGSFTRHGNGAGAVHGTFPKWVQDPMATARCQQRRCRRQQRRRSRHV